MATTFHFELVSPEKLLFSGEVTQVDAPGSEGDFGVLAGHAPVMAMVKDDAAIQVFKTAGASTENIRVSGGFAEVSDRGLTILAETAEC